MLSVFARSSQMANNKFFNTMFFGNKGKGRVLKFNRKFSPINDRYNETVPKTYAGDYNMWGLLFDPMGGLKQNTEYAMYYGSTTRPPCYEDVLWVIFPNRPIKIKSIHIQYIDKLFKIKNARVIQPLNNRIVTYAL